MANDYKEAVASLREYLDADAGGLRRLKDVTRAEQAVRSKETALKSLREAEIETTRLKSLLQREQDLRQQRERDIAAMVREAAEDRKRPLTIAARDQGRPLPAPNAEVAFTDDNRWTEAAVRGLTQNPIYCGLAGYPAIVPTEQWIRTNIAMIEREGVDQFLVNMIHLLKTTFGTVEDDEYPGFYDEDDDEDEDDV
jgi:hypothetical protein